MEAAADNGAGELLMLSCARGMKEHMFKEVTTAEFRAAIEKASDSADVKRFLTNTCRRQNDINKSTICSLSGVFALRRDLSRGVSAK